MRTTRLLLLILALTLPALAQQNCAYTYTWSKSPSFAFCVTQYGTIGMIQSPVGTNHLDPNNPVEGFEYAVEDNGGGKVTGDQVFGVELDRGIPTFSEPKGHGKLPLVATWPGVGRPETKGRSLYIEEITAAPTARTITIKFTITDCGNGCVWEGVIVRAIQPVLDGKRYCELRSIFGCWDSVRKARVAA